MKKIVSFLRPEIVAILILVGFETYLIASSDGFYYIDEGAHFVDDYQALQHPSISIGVWQRFGSVWVFALPAQCGPVTVKVFASLLFLLVIFVTYKVAELEQLPYKEWIFVLAGFQPVLLDISFTCLAELPATLFLILAYYFYKRSDWKLSLGVASLVFTCRYEMSFLAILLFIPAWRQRRFRALPYVLVGPVLWYAFSWMWTGDPTWLEKQFVSFGSIPKFIEGTSLVHYIVHSAQIFGTLQVWLVIASLFVAAYSQRIRLIIPLLTVIWCVLFNTLASAKVVNWTPSVGDFRYLATVGPFVGLLALDGLSHLMELIHNVPFSRFVPVLLALVIVFETIPAVHPHQMNALDSAVVVLTRKAASDSADIPILSNHWASRFALINQNKKIERIQPLRKENYLKDSTAFIVWDSEIANSVFSQQELTYEYVRNDSAVKFVDSTNVRFAWVSLLVRNTSKPRLVSSRQQ